MTPCRREPRRDHLRPFESPPLGRGPLSQDCLVSQDKRLPCETNLPRDASMWGIELASSPDYRSPIGHARAGACPVSAEGRTVETRDPANTQSVQRALRLLSLFGAPHGPEGKHRTDWTVSDLARTT